MRFHLILCAAILSSLFIVAAMAIAKPDVSDPTEAPEISANCFIDAGDTLSGFAEDCDFPVEVEARWDDTGNHVSGSPATGGLSSKTHFNFATSVGDANRTFTITATDSKGHWITKQVTVYP